jgi:hypothetical protein
MREEARNDHATRNTNGEQLSNREELAVADDTNAGARMGSRSAHEGAARRFALSILSIFDDAEVMKEVHDAYEKRMAEDLQAGCPKGTEAE